ncbi:16516_t:CDS:1, partial [Gigaspora rosea]
MFSMVNANPGYQSCERSSSFLNKLLINVNFAPPKPEDLYISFNTQWNFKDNYTTLNTELRFIISLYDFDNPWETISSFQDFAPGQSKIYRWDIVGIIYGLEFLNHTIEVILVDDHYIFGCSLFDRRMG